MAGQLDLQKRTVQGKKLKKLRQKGQIPSVVYGKDEPMMTMSEYNSTEKALLEAGYHSPIELLIEGEPQLAIAKSIKVEPVSRRIINVEFQAVSADAVVEATAPIKIVGFDQSPAAKAHLTILPVLEEVNVKAKPSDLPQELIADASKLTDPEDKITVADLQLPSQVELADKELAPTTVIANVYEAKVAEGEPEAPEASEESEAETSSDEKEA